jgi:hypothetical protein
VTLRETAVDDEPRGLALVSSDSVDDEDILKNKTVTGRLRQAANDASIAGGGCKQHKAVSNGSNMREQ